MILTPRGGKSGAVKFVISIFPISDLMEEMILYSTGKLVLHYNLQIMADEFAESLKKKHELFKKKRIEHFLSVCIRNKIHFNA